MIVETNYLLGYLKEHGLQHRHDVIRNHNGYYIMTETVNNEMWFNVFYDDNEHVMSDWIYSSRDIKECLDYCNIFYYDGEHYI